MAPSPNRHVLHSYRQDSKEKLERAKDNEELVEEYQLRENKWQQYHDAAEKHKRDLNHKLWAAEERIAALESENARLLKTLGTCNCLKAKDEVETNTEESQEPVRLHVREKSNSRRVKKVRWETEAAAKKASRDAF